MVHPRGHYDLDDRHSASSGTGVDCTVPRLMSGDASSGELDRVLATVRDKITRYAGKGIGEQDTKAALIVPVLRALGWDTEDLEDVKLEYKRRPSDNPVDYALVLLREPRLFIEAKALGVHLVDPKWANQFLGYAMAAGVEWVVLTDGDEYRLYNSHATVPVEEKLFRTIRISDPATRPAETLDLLLEGAAPGQPHRPVLEVRVRRSPAR